MKILLLLALLLAPAFGALADTGPKPEQVFNLVYQTTQRPAVQSVELRQCEDPACAEWEPLERRPVAFLQCFEESCVARSPTGFSRYQQLIIRFEDRLRESAVFEPREIRGPTNEYTVTVTEDALRVVENVSVGSFITFGQVILFIPALITTLLIELIVAAIYLVVRRLPKPRVLGWALLGNLVTLPLVWFGFPLLFWEVGLPFAAVLGLAELFAFGFEAGLLYLANRSVLGRREAVVLALPMNALSFFIPYVALAFS